MGQQSVPSLLFEGPLLDEHGGVFWRQVCCSVLSLLALFVLVWKLVCCSFREFLLCPISLVYNLFVFFGHQGHVCERAFRAAHSFSDMFAFFMPVSPFPFLGGPMVSCPKANLGSATNHL